MFLKLGSHVPDQNLVKCTSPPGIQIRVFQKIGAILCTCYGKAQNESCPENSDRSELKVRVSSAASSMV